MLRLIPEIGTTPEEWEKYNWEREKLVDFAGKFARNEKGEIIFNFGPPKGEPVHDNPGMLNWMEGKNFTRDTMRWVYTMQEYPYISYAPEKRALHEKHDKDKN
jgi:hypothetical protein